MSILYIEVVTYPANYMGIYIPFLVRTAPFPLWIAFFVEGVVLANLKDRNYKVVFLGVGALVMLILQYVEAKYLVSISTGGAGIKPTSFLFSFLLIAFLFSSKMEKLFLRAKGLSDILIRIGNLSFGIYLSHCYVITLISICPMPLLRNVWCLKWVVVLTLTYLMVWTGKKILPSKLASYIGF